MELPSHKRLLAGVCADVQLDHGLAGGGVVAVGAGERPLLAVHGLHVLLERLPVGVPPLTHGALLHPVPAARGLRVPALVDHLPGTQTVSYLTNGINISQTVSYLTNGIISHKRYHISQTLSYFTNGIHISQTVSYLTNGIISHKRYHISQTVSISHKRYRYLTNGIISHKRYHISQTVSYLTNA